MQFKQCEFCRAPFQYMGKSVCGDCFLKLDEDFILIREYLWENDKAGIEEVSEATGVSRRNILYLLKEERLIVGDENGKANAILTCESCKRPIHTGRMCAACKQEVVSAIQESVGPAIKPRRYKEPDEEIKSFKGVAKLELKR